MAQQLFQWISDSARNSQGVRTYERRGVAISTTSSDRAYQVGSYASVPSIGDVHPDDANAYCTDLSIDPEDDENPIGWDITANYSDENALDNDPTDDDAIVIEWDGETIEEAVFQDRDGNAILNSAGDYFLDPTPTRDQSRRIVTVQKNVASVPSWVLTYEDVVNAASFTLGGLTIAAGAAKLPFVRIGPPQKRNGTVFYELRMIFELRNGGWPLEPLDAGFRDLNASGNPVSITDDDGNLINSPALLDGTGSLLLNPSPATAVYGSFDIYAEADFSILPLT